MQAQHEGVERGELEALHGAAGAEAHSQSSSNHLVVSAHFRLPVYKCVAIEKSIDITSFCQKIEDEFLWQPLLAE